jgi:hypothetical protein
MIIRSQQNTQVKISTASKLRKDMPKTFVSHDAISLTGWDVMVTAAAIASTDNPRKRLIAWDM